MNVQPVDERDSSWEDHSPRFRVYLFTGPGPFTVHTYDVTDADVLDVIRWAQAEAGSDATYAVALVGETQPQPHGRTPRGLVWLVGMDANDQPLEPRDHETLDRMLARRGVTVVGPET